VSTRLPPILVTVLIAGGGGIVYGLLLTWFTASLRRRTSASSPLPRKTFHVAIFTAAAPVLLFFGFWGVVIYGVSISLLVFLAFRTGRGGALYDVLARADDGPAQRRYILLPHVSTALGGLLAVLLVGSFGAVGFLVCGWGDAAGEPVGRVWGRHPYRVLIGENGRTRSVEGSAAVFFAGSLGGWAALGMMGQGPLVALAVGLVCGLVGAVAEGLSSHGTDNLFMQLLPALTAWWLLG
jgi:phytol kinase